MASVAYSRTNGQITGSPDQYFFIARKSDVFSLVGNGGSHEGTRNGTTTDISTSILAGMGRLVNE